jgi:hypothetical protein
MPEQYLRLNQGDPLPKLDGLSPFKAVIIVEADADADWQSNVCRWIVDAGCRFAMTWGQDCELWHDSIDTANLEQFDYGDIPEDDFIMTTWHQNEPLEEAIWFAKWSALHPTLDVSNVLFLHIGTADREEEILSLFASA